MQGIWSKWLVRTALAVAAFTMVAVGTVGCSNSGGVSLIGISPTSTVVLDAGQTVTLSASVVNDYGNAGVRWALNGAGTLGTPASNNGLGGVSTFNTITYNAPATVTGPTTITVVATSVHTPSQTGTFTIVINPGIVFTTGAALPAGTAGVPYSTTIAVTGGAGTVSLATTGAPAGLTLSKAGVLSGTPTAAGTFTLSVSATDQAPTPQTVTQSFTLTIAPVITTKSVPNALTGTPYPTAAAPGLQLAYLGGGTPSFAITAGSLPASSGLTLSSSGVLSGTPAAGTSGSVYTFSVVVTVGGAASAAVPYTITVTAPVTITNAPTLPAGSYGVTYPPVQLSATGGTGTGYTYALTGTGAPAGLTVSTSGLISFATTPTLAGTYTFKVTVMDSASTAGSQTFTLVIAPTTLTITTTTLPNGNLAVAYSQTLKTSGGDGTTPTFAITSGSLAGSGLALSAAGVISGAPIANGTYSFSVVATQAAGSSAPQPLTITVSNLSITTGATANGEVNLPFSFPEAVRGGTGPYTWKIGTGGSALPAGLSIIASTGQIVGTPTTATATPVTVQVAVTDSTSSTTNQNVAITIYPARTSADNSQFLGQYAFLLSGYDQAQNPLTLAGKITVDGLGNVLSGVYDANRLVQTSVTGSVTVTGGSYVLGSDNRGRLTLITSAGTTVFVMAMNKPVAGVTQTGYLTEFDSSGQSLTGSIALEDPTAFATASVTGGYAFGLQGLNGSTTAVTNHSGLIGEFQISAGTVSSSEYLATTTGTTPVVPASGALTIAANGRGTLTLTSSAGNQSFVVYVVSAKQLYLTTTPTTGNGPLLSGSALQQTIANGSFAASSLSATSVARVLRIDQPASATQPVPDISLGVMNFTTAGKVTFTGDENQGGSASQFTTTGALTVAANGRGSVPLSAGFGGCVLCASTSTYFYLVGANQGFLLDFLGGSGTGYFEPQSMAAFTSAAISGTYVGGTIQPLAQGSIYGVRALNAVGSAPLTGTQDFNVNGLLTPDVAFNATYTIAANGRAVISPNDGTAPVFYLVSPTKAIRLDTTATSPVLQEIVQ